MVTMSILKLQNTVISQLPVDFNPNSRVWIYQADRVFTPAESAEIKELLTHFVDQWNTHGDKVKGFANVFFDRFVVFMADETNFSVSGCSTDSSVRVIKSIEEKYKVGMFNRQLLVFMIDGQFTEISLAEVSSSIQSNLINEHTHFFDNTILTKQEFESNWINQLKDSWLKVKI